MAVYVLHFSGTLGTTGRNSARHYVGYSPDARVNIRVSEHRSGTGASITRAAIARGFTLELARVIPNATRTDERKIKNSGHFDRMCPFCHV